MAKIVAMPTAKEGAPPVRANNVDSPTSEANWFICSRETENPHELIFDITSDGSFPTIPAGLLIAK